MTKPFVFVAVTLLTTVSLAQDLLECVDPDIRAGLLFQGIEINRIISREAPEVLSDVSVPGDFQFVGSSVSNLQISAAYKTTLAPVAAMLEIISVLGNAGWESFGNSGRSISGFVSPAQPAYSALCREGEMLTVVSREANDATFVNLNTIGNRGSVPCCTDGPQLGRLSGPTGIGVSQFMPRLSLPEGTQVGGQRGMIGIASGVSGSNRSASTSVPIETSLGTQGLAEHFRRQLEEQGWFLDGNWIASVSAGSTWTATRADDVHLVGLLDIVAVGDTDYEASFRLTLVD